MDLTAIVGLTGSLSAAAGAMAQKYMDYAASRRKDMFSRIEALEARLDLKAEQIEKLQAQLHTAEEAAVTLQAQLRTAEEAAVALRAQVEQLSAQLDVLNTKKAEVIS